MRRLIQQWVIEQARRDPDAIALVGNDERLTYGELEENSTRLAKMLKEAGCKRGDRVGLLLPKSPVAVVGIVGILKADCIYVPIDLSNPVLRVAHMIASCEARCLLAGDGSRRLLDELFEEHYLGGTIPVVWMGSDGLELKASNTTFSVADCRACSPAGLDYQNTPDDAAYILFTSGSTGKPKGVVITHANVVRFVEWATQYFGMDSSDRLSGHNPFHFDLSVFDVFGTLAAGAQLHLVPKDFNLLPNKLAEFIRDRKLTQWFSVPSVLTYMTKFDVVQFNDFPTLRRLLWCGEVLPTPILMYWMKRLPTVTFTNLYGPTETTIASSYYTVPRCPDDGEAPIPIGTGCAGEELLVLDDHLQPVRPGEVGDLYIRGVGLSPGYWRDPEKTATVFLRNPHSSDPSDRIYQTGDLAKIGSDGLVYFLGRADSQIKSRGYRIELGEIEAALNCLAGLRECAVVAIPADGFEGATICCAYVPAPDARVTPIALRRQLASMLPPYMLRIRWMAFDSLPKNANGKIDRRQLQEAFQNHATQSP